jgi:hypothetical protein
MDLLKKTIFLILLFGCTKYSELGKNENGDFFFQTSDIHLKKVKIIPWPVGIKEKDTISKGMSLTITYPKLEKKDLEKLHKNLGLDSWIVRVRKNSTLGSRALGYFYAPIFQPGRFGVKNLRARQIKSSEVLVYYTAAALSDRLQSFPCPVLNHRRKIVDWELSKVSDDPVTLTITPGIGVPIDAKLDPFSYAPQMINGGLELIGRYNLELAAFDHHNKRVISNWVDVPEHFRIDKEDETVLPDCTNWEPPAKSPDYHDWQRFKWKRDSR